MLQCSAVSWYQYRETFAIARVFTYISLGMLKYKLIKCIKSSSDRDDLANDPRNLARMAQTAVFANKIAHFFILNLKVFQNTLKTNRPLNVSNLCSVLAKTFHSIGPCLLVA